MASGYHTIVVDPPWHYEERFASYSGDRRSGRPLPYPSMDVADMAALPIRAMADEHGCWLFCWTTNRYIGAAFPLVEAWGFEYAATVVWHKTGGVSPFSRSYVSKITDAEFLLVGRCGDPPRGEPLPSLVIEAPRTGEHSKKPECFLDYVERFSGEPRLEMFSRRARFGWDTWGDEALGGVDLPCAAGPQGLTG